MPVFVCNSHRARDNIKITVTHRRKIAIACGCTLANVNTADFDDGLQVVLQIIEETKKIYTIITDSISEEKLQTCYETSKMICDNIDKFYKE